ncbi:MAG: LCP family protein [Clostridia bacterium]|nr:LCP family protein [Clostridia bacterium]
MVSGEKKRKYLRCAAIVFLCVFVLSAGFFVLELWESKQGLFADSGAHTDGEESVFLDGKEYVAKDNIETVLVMGLDKFEGVSTGDSYNNDRQADFLMLFVFDNKENVCTALHINRDTMAEMNVLGVAGNKVGTITQQLALAHTYGNGKEVSCRNAANAVSKLLLGAPIDHYLSVTMDAVPVFTDLVGGVEVEVLDDFAGIDDTLVKGERVTLTGEHALHYVRTRYGLEDSTNESRMARQRQFLKALYEKTDVCIENDDAFVADAVVKMSEYIVSDCSGNHLQTLFEKITTYQLDTIRSLEGKTVLGEEHMEFYPEAGSITAVVADLFYTAVE